MFLSAFYLILQMGKFVSGFLFFQICPFVLFIFLYIDSWVKDNCVNKDKIVMGQ